MQFARLPAINSLLQAESGRQLVLRFGHDAVTRAARTLLAEYRTNPDDLADMDRQAIAEQALRILGERLDRQFDSTLKPVLNLTGTVLHTNLGRAPLPAAALEAINTIAAGNSNLEFRTGEGVRGDRDEHIEGLIAEITGAEAATVVNNNAAAVMLTLNSLALRRSVIVSRGELVEIGGSFRIPEIMDRSGARLVEVGATNRTHPRDYDAAVDDNTALIMKVHTSNYAVVGFTSGVEEADLADLAHRHDLPFVTDLGSGTLVALEKFGLPHEPTVQEALTAGADLVTFSGDKLLGGPQAGIVVGRRDLIRQLKQNPMKRALRVDKLTLAALHAVLSLYRDPDRLAEQIPTITMLSRDEATIRATAVRASEALVPLLPGFDVAVVAVNSQIGSGALPTDLLPSAAVAISPTDGSDRQLTELASRLRQLPLPVIGRLHDGRLLLDCRTLASAEPLIQALAALSAP